MGKLSRIIGCRYEVGSESPIYNLPEGLIHRVRMIRYDGGA